MVIRVNTTLSWPIQAQAQHGEAPVGRFGFGSSWAGSALEIRGPLRLGKVAGRFGSASALTPSSAHGGLWAVSALKEKDCRIVNALMKKGSNGGGSSGSDSGGSSGSGDGGGNGMPGIKCV